MATSGDCFESNRSLDECLAKRYLPRETVQLMYRSVNEPYFRYCCPIWGSTSSTNLQRLQKLPNRAARIVTDSPYDAHSEPLIKKAQLAHY